MDQHDRVAKHNHWAYDSAVDDMARCVPSQALYPQRDN